MKPEVKGLGLIFVMCFMTVFINGCGDGDGSRYESRPDQSSVTSGSLNHFSVLNQGRQEILRKTVSILGSTAEKDLRLITGSKTATPPEYCGITKSKMLIKDFLIHPAHFRPGAVHDIGCLDVLVFDKLNHHNKKTYLNMEAGPLLGQFYDSAPPLPLTFDNSGHEVRIDEKKEFEIHRFDRSLAYRGVKKSICLQLDLNDLHSMQPYEEFFQFTYWKDISSPPAPDPDPPPCGCPNPLDQEQQSNGMDQNDACYCDLNETEDTVETEAASCSGGDGDDDGPDDGGGCGEGPHGGGQQQTPFIYPCQKGQVIPVVWGQEVILEWDKKLTPYLEHAPDAQGPMGRLVYLMHVLKYFAPEKVDVGDQFKEVFLRGQTKDGEDAGVQCSIYFLDEDELCL